MKSTPISKITTIRIYETTDWWRFASMKDAVKHQEIIDHKSRTLTKIEADKLGSGRINKECRRCEYWTLNPKHKNYKCYTHKCPAYIRDQSQKTKNHA